MDLDRMRRAYGLGELREADLHPDPVLQVTQWLAQATEFGIAEPNAMVLATADTAGRPSARTVLLKQLDQRGFAFFTNHRSRKGDDLAGNPRAALLFPWHAMERQVRVEGTADRIDQDEVDAYFATRPRESQLGAWASQQSQPVESREALDLRYASFERRFAGQAAIPRPSSWGGYRVRPELVELWQGRAGRLHDRLRYRRGTDGWSLDRLQP